MSLADSEWNKMQLTIIGVIRVLIDNNKKLVLHMLKSLIQKEEYFINRGDHAIASMGSVPVSPSL